MRKLLLSALVALLGMSFLASNAETRSPKEAVNRNLDIFTSIYKELQTSYVDTIDVDKSMRIAIDAMLGNIDPYTEYYPEEQQDELLVISTGEYGGIGAYIAQRGPYTYISEPQVGSPAIKAGLLAGDKIIKIDNDTMVGLGSDKVREHLRGQAGSSFRITVSRPYVGADSIREFDVVREKIDLNPMPYYGVLRDTIGYIQLTTFNEKSADKVRDALLELKADPRVKVIALDLRGNGGGILEGAVKIVGLFVPKGTEVVRTRGRGLLNEKVYKTTSKPIDTETPLVVLIDDGSASASEIVTGALQDLDRAVIIGGRSFGKGLVQSSRQLPYHGLLKLTIAKYYIPSGRLIQAIDYSRRNPDGTVSRIPDSLTTVFHTKAGREVRDGGGITPDIKVTYPEGNRLVFNIVNDLWAFDFATKYAAEHSSLPSPAEFTVSDSLYAEFKKFVDPSRLNYDKVCEVMVDRLEEAAKIEGYMTDSVQAQIDQLKVMLHHNLDKDLDINRRDISRYLESEIATRYYNRPGSIQSGLRYDPAVDTIVGLMNTPGRYKEILAPKNK